MPRVRKLSDDEVRQVEAEQRATICAWGAAEQLADGRAKAPPRAGRAVRTTPPLIGDVVDLPGREQGIVLRVRRAHDGSWDVAELLVNRQRRWVRADHIGPVTGRPVGISRIDHPRKRTYGWYVRAYKGKETKVARFFSDQKYGGRASALAAALAYQQYTAGQSPSPRLGEGAGGWGVKR